jgi:parallel beta-helix repeat protein
LSRKVVYGLTVVLLLAAVLTAFNVKPVEALWIGGTIYIKADGSIDPPDAPIITYDNITYTLTDDIASLDNGIIVERDGIVIDGANHTIQYQGYGICPRAGIFFKGRNNVTIKNMVIKSFGYGISFYNSSNIEIVGNRIENSDIGIDQLGPFTWVESSNISIIGNILENNTIGIRLTLSSNNVIGGNIFSHCGLVVYGSHRNSVFENLVNGKPLIYLENARDLEIVEDAGQVILVNCQNITVRNLNLSNTSVGIELWETNATTLSENNIENNQIGILLEDCTYAYNSIRGNDIKNNGVGIKLAGSSENHIAENIIAQNGLGIELLCARSNSIVGNRIENNSKAIELTHTASNVIYHNNFVNNVNQIGEIYDSANVWDNGYPSGGNYWSDYTDLDEKSGPNQDQPGSDGIWDHPYVIDKYNIDHYPFVSPTHNRPPFVVVLSPNGGEKWAVGSRQTIRWTAEDDFDRPEELKINLYYSTDSGTTWEPIELEVENTGEYEWVIPETPSNSCRVKVEAVDSGGLVGSDVSDADFTIYKVAYGAEITCVKAFPNPVGQGSKMIFNITVYNYGEKDISSATVYTKIYDPAGKLVKTLSTTIKAFKHDTERTVQMTYTLPSKAALGDWSYRIQVYMGKTLLDEALDNTFTVETASITGEILSVSDDGPVSPGKAISFTVEIENTGNIIWKSGNAKIVVKIYDPTGKLVKTLTKTLKETIPGLEYTYSLSWKLPTKAKKGTYTYDVYLYHGKLLLDKSVDNSFEVE